MGVIREAAKAPFHTPMHWWLYHRDHHSLTCPNRDMGGNPIVDHNCDHCLTYRPRHAK